MKQINRLKNVIAIVVFFLCLTSSANSEPKTITENIKTPEQRYMLSGAFDITYEFMAAKVRQSDNDAKLDVYILPDGLNEIHKSFIWFNFGKFFADYGSPLNVKINLIRPESGEDGQYWLCRIFVNGKDIYKAEYSPKNKSMMSIGGEIYLNAGIGNRVNNPSEKFSIFLGGINNVKVSRIKLYGSDSYDKTPSMQQLFDDRKLADRKFYKVEP